MKKESLFRFALTLTMLIISADVAKSQCNDWGWIDQISSQFDVYVKNVCTDSSGNVYVIGYGGNGTTVGDSIHSGDTYVIQLNSQTGAVKWLKSISGKFSQNDRAGIVADNQGYIYITGSFTNIMNFGDTSIGSFGQRGAYVAKLDTTGAFQWLRQGKNYDNWIINGNEVVVDNQGNVTYIGNYIDSMDLGDTILYVSGTSDRFIVQYDANGNFNWVHSIPTVYNSYLGAIFADNTGDIYVAGYFGWSFSGAVTFPDTTIASVGNTDFFFAKYASNGQYLWVKHGAGPDNDGLYAIDDDANGNIYIIGYHRGGLTFEDTTLVNSSGKYAAFIAKFDSTDQLVWIKDTVTNTNNFPDDMAIANSDRIAISGAFLDSIIIGDTILYGGSVYQTYLAEYDLNGNFLWVDQIEGNSSGLFTQVAKNAQGNIFLVTGFEDTIYVADTFYVSTTSLTNQDGLIASYCVQPSPAALSPDTTLTINGDTIFCEGDSVILSVPATSGTYQWYKDGSILANDTTNSLTVFASGGYYAILFLGGTYDTTRQINVTVNPAFSNTLNSSICSGDSLLAGGSYQTTSGTYYDSLSTSNGCDSVTITILIVNSIDTTNISTSMCEGDSIMLGGGYQTTDGIYYDTYSGANGCDSVVATTLAVNPTYNISQTESICQGDSVMLGGTYQTTSGTYYDSLSTSNGCDSVTITNLIVNSIDTTNISTSMCEGDSIMLGGGYQTTDGIYYDTYSGANSCDSVVATTLAVNPTYNISQTESICQGDSVMLGGTYQTTSGTYYDSLSTSNGCDSVITTNLTVTTVDTSVSVSGSTLTANVTGANYQWIDCNANQSISGETNQIFTADSSGLYAVEVIQNGCTDTSSCYSISIVGIKDNSSEYKVSVYPNPFNNHTIIKFENSTEAKHDLIIFDVMGHIVRSITDISAGQIKIERKSLASGLYFFQLQNEGQKVAIGKLMIQ